MLFLSIPKPCHENWDDMLPDERGSFCNVCSKTVVDFTKLNDEEVKNYFTQQAGQKTCGRFRNDQLIDPENPLPHILATSIPFWKKFLAILLVLFGSLLSSCGKAAKEKVETPPVIERQDKKAEQIVGYIMPEEVEISVPQECTTTMGLTIPKIIEDTVIFSEEIMGDIEIEPIIDQPRVLNPIEVTYNKVLPIDSVKKDKLRSVADSIKKLTGVPHDCDTLPIKPIEP